MTGQTKTKVEIWNPVQEEEGIPLEAVKDAVRESVPHQDGDEITLLGFINADCPCAGGVQCSVFAVVSGTGDCFRVQINGTSKNWEVATTDWCRGWEQIRERIRIPSGV